jgi:hypothetical protein
MFPPVSVGDHIQTGDLQDSIHHYTAIRSVNSSHYQRLLVEDGHGTFLQNIDNHIQEYTASQARIPQSTSSDWLINIKFAIWFIRREKHVNMAYKQKVSPVTQSGIIGLYHSYILSTKDHNFISKTVLIHRNLSFIFSFRKTVL